VKDIGTAGYPKGPAGRFANLGCHSLGVMSYSNNVDGAKDFLEWWTQPEQFQAWLKAYGGYDLTPLPKYLDLPVYTEDPKMAPYSEVAKYARNKGYAGPANQKAAEAYSKYIIIDAYAKAIQDNDAKGAIESAAKQLERIYNR
jgi:multiple sugar transport system substrate-binding protein